MGKRCPDVDPKKTDFMTENFDYRDQAEGIWYNGHPLGVIAFTQL
jgi:hypothetical protein